MEKVIDLLISERVQTERAIEFFKKEIERDKEAIEQLQSPNFIERHKDSSNWTESWTIEQFIRCNVSSYNRAITKYTEKLGEANEYLLQIERALDIVRRIRRKCK